MTLSIAAYVHEFLTVNVKLPVTDTGSFDKKGRSKYRVPDGNTILNMYGKYLFEAAKMNTPGYVMAHKIRAH